MKRVTVLVSGGGTNLQALLESERRGENPNGRIVLVVASKPGVYALERAASFGVESAVVSRKDYADSAAFDAALLDTLQSHNIDVVVLAGFLSVLGEKVIAAYRNKIINVHPSLIPSFAGEPLRVAIDENAPDKFADKLWKNLNEDNKVSLFVRSIELETGTYEDIILNKYTAVEG